MKKEIAEKWIAELRSGKWKQGRSALNHGDKHCCLGVLCELAATENICKRDVDSDDDTTFDSEFGVLPDSVMTWAGVKHKLGLINPAVICQNLARYNDNGKTFLEIADIIEANIDNL